MSVCTHCTGRDNVSPWSTDVPSYIWYMQRF